MKDMKWVWGFAILFITTAIGIEAHDGQSSDSSFIRWVGNFHPVILHFPIALLLTGGFAELLFSWSSRDIFDHSARFMILIAAITAVPTVLFGLALGYSLEYPGVFDEMIDSHRISGITTALLLIVAAYLREYYYRGMLYYIFLVASIISVSVTGYLGGLMSFGEFSLLPPI